MVFFVVTVFSSHKQTVLSFSPRQSILHKLVSMQPEFQYQCRNRRTITLLSSYRRVTAWKMAAFERQTDFPVLGLLMNFLCSQLLRKTG